MRLYVATSNPGKLRDFAHAAEGHLLGGERIQIEPLPGLAAIPAPPEDEPSFDANARTKALAYSRFAPGLMVLADDSGLEVDGLGGAPGVRSARYAEDLNFAGAAGSTVDERNNVALLRGLEGVPETRRRGRYRCVLALARDGEIVATAEGALEGRILSTPQGGLGFGYDPLFFLPELGRTMAELDPATRLAMSHRGRALRNLLEHFPEARLAGGAGEKS
ncbi:MAG TPA: non-canonical purine NTP pyrophosphatase [Acidobacteriaceae bacterium]|jgi:XTP/dITP diphosphohydrolase